MFQSASKHLSKTANNAIQLKAKWNGTVETWSTANDVITSTDIYYHIVLSYDLSDPSNDPVLYINGVVVPWATEPSPTGTLNAFSTNPAHFTGIGAGGSAGNRAYIDEFAIWSRILSPAEVIKIEGNGRRKSIDGLGVKNNLELWYGMGDSTDNRFKIVDSNIKFHDMSGNNRHSTSAAGVNIELEGEYTGNFHKYHRNTTYRLEDGNFQSRPRLVGVRDNAHISTQMPRSEFQYSWIDSTLRHDFGIKSGKQYIYGYQSKNGEEIVDIKGENITIKDSITFPSGSEIFGNLV